jgi:hypothetical protein
MFFLKKGLNTDISDYLFNDLYSKIEWEDGIKTRTNNFTRKAKMVSQNSPLFQELLPFIESCLEQMTTKRYNILGFYLNLYENGEMYTPTHSHKGTEQLVISLGETRVFTINSKEYKMESGDCILFGSQLHGIPKSKIPCGPRISIATFMTVVS